MTQRQMEHFVRPGTKAKTFNFNLKNPTYPIAAQSILAKRWFPASATQPLARLYQSWDREGYAVSFLKRLLDRRLSAVQRVLSG